VLERTSSGELKGIEMNVRGVRERRPRQGGWKIDCHGIERVGNHVVTDRKRRKEVPKKTWVGGETILAKRVQSLGNNQLRKEHVLITPERGARKKSPRQVKKTK